MSKVQNFLKKSHLYPALVLEFYFTPRKRRIIRRVTKYILLSIPVVIIFAIITDNYGLSISTDTLLRKLIGLALLAFGLHSLMIIFGAYFASIYYSEYLQKNRYTSIEAYTFSAGRLLRRAKNDNLLTALLTSKRVGQKILLRLGIKENEIKALLEKQKSIENPPVFNTETTEIVKVSTVINFIYDNYADLRTLLDKHGIDQKELQETVDWVIYQIEAEAYDWQWWRPEKLAKIPGVAADWSFGRTYLLSRFSRDIKQDTEANSEAINLGNRTRELTQLQAVLNRTRGTNALIVGNPGQEKMEVLWALTKQLTEEKILLLLTQKLASACVDASDFEEKINTIFTEAERAGNIILAIDNLPHLILQAKHFNINLNEILAPYLSTVGGKIIALADSEFFHTLIEKDKSLMTQFEVITTRALSDIDIVKTISREVLVAEKKYQVYYTYPAVAEIAKSAEYYFPNGVTSDKAQDLLAEISPWANSQNLNIIDREDILRYISEKTNIPTGAVTDIEKDKLLNLETLLMKRVVAQREAVFAISSAIRRNRAGIRNEKRPIGSFLFLGPTGVGKTETAKALASVFFGDEDNLLRLDMSEYQGKESLARLIGDTSTNTPGVLANLLTDHPYGVLLLDEFEKTHKEVMNLFLQILDEGYFTDAFSKKVMARNIIFIATSNAGAEEIFRLTNNNENLEQHSDAIISKIVADGILRPELINRFDGTIIFHPLTKENLLEISKLMLKKVANRLAEKGITLNISRQLLDFTVKHGYNPSFGARPMNRLIQNTVEDHLSDLIIRGKLTGGKKIDFQVIGKTEAKTSLEPIIS